MNTIIFIYAFRLFANGFLGTLFSRTIATSFLLFIISAMTLSPTVLVRSSVALNFIILHFIFASNIERQNFSNIERPLSKQLRSKFCRSHPNLFPQSVMSVFQTIASKFRSAFNGVACTFWRPPTRIFDSQKCTATISNVDRFKKLLHQNEA